MEFQSTPIEGLVLIKPKRFTDNRGYFMESYRKDIFDSNVKNVDFVQDNESESQRGVLRGLHLQKGDKAQAKLVRVVEGEVFDVAVDLREGSPTLGKWFGIRLSQENGLSLFIPRGFAHGFLVLSDKAKFVYKVDNYYAPEAELTISAEDADIGIEWPELACGYILSERDTLNAVSLKEYLESVETKA